MYFDHILLYSSSIVSPFQIHVFFFKKKIYLTDPLSPVNAAQMRIAKESSFVVCTTYHCPHAKEKQLSLPRQSWIDKSTSTRSKTSVAPSTSLLEVLHDSILSRSYTDSHSCCEFMLATALSHPENISQPLPLSPALTLCLLLALWCSEIFGTKENCRSTYMSNPYLVPIITYFQDFNSYDCLIH